MLRTLRMILSCRKGRLEKTKGSYYQGARFFSHNIFGRMESAIIEKELFLKQRLSLSDMAMEVGTNRTYISMAIRFMNISFRDYINIFRIKYMLELIRSSLSNNFRQRLDGEDLALSCGFSGKRAMNDSLKKILGLRYCEIRRSDSVQIEKLSTFVTQKYNYGRRKSNIFNERCGEDNSSE